MLDLWDLYRPVPDLDCTIEVSVLLMSPLALTSVRKLELLTGFPDWAWTRLVSVELTSPLALTSPRRTPICTEAALLKLPTESLTLLRLTVIT